MDSKNKPGQKGGESHGKQQQQHRPGTEQVRSGTNIQKGEAEKIQQPKAGEPLKQKHEQVKKP
jgi:hypothetical protein